MLYALACYDKELSKSSGSVTTVFVIGPDGKAAEALIKESTLHQPNIEACILKTIRNIQFPIPKGGGKVQVTYPFKFKPN